MLRRVCLSLGATLIVLTVACAGLATGTSSGRAAVKTLLFISAVVPVTEMQLQELFTDPPLHEDVVLATPAGPREGDLYRPAGDGPFPAVLLFLGVAPAAGDDPRVVNLGQALARSGMVVLWYWSPVFIEKRIDPDEVTNLVAAFQYLQSRPEVDRSRVGLGGFCVGASFVLLAAASEPIREEVAFVNAFGPYHDARDLVRAFASQSRFDEQAEGVVVPWEPDRLIREVLSLHFIDALPDPTEQRLLSKAFLESSGRLPDPLDLSSEAMAVYRLLDGVPLGEVDAVIGRLPAKLRDGFAAISPSAYVDRIVAPVLIMHATDDRLVPVEESRRLARALRNAERPVEFTEFSLFEHVTPDASIPPHVLVSELWKLFRHMHRIMLQAS